MSCEHLNILCNHSNCSLGSQPKCASSICDNPTKNELPSPGEIICLSFWNGDCKESMSELYFEVDSYIEKKIFKNCAVSF